MTDRDVGFIAGIVTSWITFALCALVVVTAFDKEPEPLSLCEEDEVYAWQHNPADYPTNINWECVSYDDLIRYMVER